MAEDYANWARVVTDSKLGFGRLALRSSKRKFIYTWMKPGSEGSNPSGLTLKMEHPIVEKILKEGVSSVNLSMLDEASRKRILSDVGEKLYKQNRFIEAIEIMTQEGNMEKLIKKGDSFLAEGKAELAALCFIPAKDKQRLNNAAVLCIKMKNYKLAAKAYQAAENSQMADFIQKNFA